MHPYFMMIIMTFHAEFQTGLREADLAPGEAKRPTSLSGLSENHYVLRSGANILFQGPPRYSDRDRLNLADGTLYVADLGRNEHGRLDAITGGVFPRTRVEGGRVEAPLMFELERLFIRPLESLELIPEKVGDNFMEAERKDVELYIEETRSAAQAWLEAYKKAVDGSRIGKPVMERCYQAEVRMRQPIEQLSAIFSGQILRALQDAYNPRQTKAKIR